MPDDADKLLSDLQVAENTLTRFNNQDERLKTALASLKEVIKQLKNYINDRRTGFKRKT